MELLHNLVEKLPEQNRLEQQMDTVKNYIRIFADHGKLDTQVRAVIEDAIATQGKMIRPQLLLLSAAFGPEFERVSDRLYRLAAIIELTHLASLIHDDIIDDAPTRRGKPSIQGKYNKNAAVYAGDYLLSRISYYISSSGFNRAGVVLSEAVEAMCVGEINQAVSKYKEDVTVDGYMQNIHGKTAALFMAACRIGAEESGCDENTIRLMERFGEYMGIMFQLRDDLLDFTSNDADMGKETHKDFRDGIYTMPLLCALEHPQGRTELLPIMRLNAEIVLSDDEIRHMERLVVNYGGVEATREKIRHYQKQAEICAEGLPQSRLSNLLCNMLVRLKI